MVLLRKSAARRVNAREAQARAEWRDLCFVLEGLQATHILAGSYTKFAFARAYAAFRAGEARTVAELTVAISQGDFRFFVDRGVAPAVLSESFIRQLLRDWRAAIASKQARLAAAFEGRFGEEIDVFSAIPRNSAAIFEAKCDEHCNALSLLNRWSAAFAPAA